MSTRQRGYAISVEAVTLDRGGRRIIDDVSLTVDQPGITAIIGPNGAGKSSLLAVMAGLLEADTGNRKFTNAAGEVAAITRIGFMLQRPVLLRRSLTANLCFAMDAAGIARDEQQERAEAVLAKMGLAEKSELSALQLSQGERQRLALARVIAMDAGLMMFDEATNNLDPATVLMIEDTARKLAKEGRPVLWVSHDLAQVKRLADRVVMMVAGRIEADSAAKAFFATPPTRRAKAFLKGDLVTG